MKYQTNKAEIDRNEIIQIEKEAARHADYTGIEKPPSVTNNGRSMKFNQLVSFFDNISTEKDTLKRSRKLEKLFDVSISLSPYFVDTTSVSSQTIWQ